MMKNYVENKKLIKDDKNKNKKNSMKQIELPKKNNVQKMKLNENKMKSNEKKKHRKN